MRNMTNMCLIFPNLKVFQFIYDAAKLILIRNLNDPWSHMTNIYINQIFSYVMINNHEKNEAVARNI